MTTRIQRRRTKGWRMPEGAIYVGRPSPWGNVAKVGEPWIEWHGGHNYRVDLDCVIEDPAHAALAFHRGAIARLMNEPEWLAPLRGHDLACWCPLTYPDGIIVPCHADVLLELANRDEGNRLRLDDRETV